MLTIRLQRAGKRNTAQYKVVLAQKTAANQKKFVEILGSYNPHTKELGIRSNDRLNYWMNDQHVELSATIHNLFVTKELVKADKTKSFTIPKKPVVAEEVPAKEEVAPTPAETPAETTPETAPETPVEVPTPETTTDAPISPEATESADQTIEPAVEAIAETEPEMVVAVEEVPTEVPIETTAPEQATK